MIFVDTWTKIFDHRNLNQLSIELGLKNRVNKYKYLLGKMIDAILPLLYVPGT